MNESMTSRPLGQSEDIDANVDLPGVGTVQSDVRRRMSYAILGLACAGGLALMVFRHGPRSASAAGIMSPSSEATVKDVLTGDVAEVKQMDAALIGTDKVVAGFRFSPALVQVPLSDLRGNPFHSAPFDADDAVPAKSVQLRD